MAEKYSPNKLIGDEGQYTVLYRLYFMATLFIWEESGMLVWELECQGRNADD